MTAVGRSLFARGDVVLVDFAPARTGEADFTRPAIIVTNDRANAFAPVVAVVPLTSNTERVYPMQVVLSHHRTGLDRDSKAQVELIRHVAVGRIQGTIGNVPEELMHDLDERIREHLAL